MDMGDTVMVDMVMVDTVMADMVVEDTVVVDMVVEDMVDMDMLEDMDTVAIVATDIGTAATDIWEFTIIRDMEVVGMVDMVDIDMVVDIYHCIALCNIQCCWILVIFNLSIKSDPVLNKLKFSISYVQLSMLYCITSSKW